MHLAPRRLADTVVLRPAGGINHVSSDGHVRSDGLTSALAPFLASCAAGRDQIVLDLSGLACISSAGLRVLMLSTGARTARTSSRWLSPDRPDRG
jgi:hypothetical protein